MKKEIVLWFILVALTVFIAWNYYKPKKEQRTEDYLICNTQMMFCASSDLENKKGYRIELGCNDPINCTVFTIKEKKY